MIPVLLRDLRWRLLTLLLVSFALYALEPGFHQHEELDLQAVALGPLGISSTLSYFAGLAMIVLLAGFVSRDVREGHTRLFFAHPTSPLTFYATRWALAYVLTIIGATLFLVLGQVIAWGEFLGGWSGLILPAVSALIYGGLIAFFSVLLPRGDTWVVFLLFLPTFFPQLLTMGLAPLSPTVRDAILLLMPPHGALQEIWDGLLSGSVAWGAVAFAAAYGAVLLGAAGLILTLKEWP